MTHFFTFLRHGQSVASHDGLLQGHLDSPLTDLGEQQAQVLADSWLRDSRRYDRIVSSPLRRARQTAEILAARLSAPVEMEPAWMERYLGRAQGRSVASLLDASPNGPLSPPFSPAYEDGEGAWELYLRAAAAVQALVRQPPGRVLVVSHGGILNAALRAILGLAPSPGFPIRFDLGNCGYADVSMQANGAWTLHALCHPSGPPALEDECDR